MSHVTYIDEEHQSLTFWCPGCDSPHAISYGPGRWAWNGDRDRPTFTPSVLSNAGRECPDLPRCHSFVTGGSIKFLSDSTHALAGQSVPLARW